MSFPDKLFLGPTSGVAKEFVRVQDLASESLYRDKAALGSPSIIENSLRIRTTEKGSLREPSTWRGTHNLNRVMSVMVEGKVYTASVNLTVTLPGGNVVDDSAISAMLSEMQCIFTGMSSSNPTALAPWTPGENIAAPYVEAVQLLLT